MKNTHIPFTQINLFLIFYLILPIIATIYVSI